MKRVQSTVENHFFKLHYAESPKSTPLANTEPPALYLDWLHKTRTALNGLVNDMAG